MNLLFPAAHAIAAADYLKAKLQVEATPAALNAVMSKTPCPVEVVDVRDEASYSRGHILGAVSIPLEDMVSRMADLHKTRTIVTYCQDASCPLAVKAALELAQKGFRVQFLVGGFAEWKKKGYETGKGWAA